MEILILGIIAPIIVYLFTDWHSRRKKPDPIDFPDLKVNIPNLKIDINKIMKNLQDAMNIFK